MMQSILTAVMVQRKQGRSYLTDELIVTTRKIPRTCTSIAYKKQQLENELSEKSIIVSSLTISSYTRIENVRHQGVIVTERELYCSLTKKQQLLKKSKFTNMLAVILNRHLIKRKGGTRKNLKPRIPPHPTTKQGILLLRLMGGSCAEKDDYYADYSKYHAQYVVAKFNIAKEIQKNGKQFEGAG